MSTSSNLEAVQDSDKPVIMTTTNAVERSSSAATVQAPGAWVPDDDEHELSLVDIGEAVAGALGAAGTAAAKYLPASVVNTFAAYAPGSNNVGNQTTNTNGLDSSNDVQVARAPPLTMEPATASAIPEHALTTHPLREPEGQGPAISTGANPTDSGFEVGRHSPVSSFVPSAAVPTSELAGFTTTAAQMPWPPAVPPLSSPQSPPTDSYSTTAVTGHESFSPSMRTRPGNVAPPPSSATGYTWEDSRAADGPLTSKLPSGAPTPAPLIKDPNTAVLASGASSGTGVPSSALSMKSGYVGDGPTSAMVQSGVTPRGSELDKDSDDLAYLAPHIRAQGSTPADSVPAPAIPAQPLPQTSRFSEDVGAYPTPPDTASDAPHHSRDSSISNSGSASASGGTGTRRVSLVKRIKGEAKIIAGKIKKDEAKVSEGRAILDGEA